MFTTIRSYLFILILLPWTTYISGDTKIAVIGTGYVGLVSGAGLAEFNNEVICADIDTEKIAKLNNGIMPIYETNLEDLVRRNVQKGKLSFTNDIVYAMTTSDVIFIAVGTPMKDDGSADLSYINEVVDMIAQNINGYKIIVTKSTVPVGTGKKIRARLEHNFGINPTLFSIVSNPEFLREGIAVYDFLHPDRLIIGSDSDKALTTMCKIYEPLIMDGTIRILTDIQTAEMIKYASNAFLALKISYINEIANLCDATDADVKMVAQAMGLDHRISPYFLKPGPGFGGSCFPKDSQAIINIAQQYKLPMLTVEASLATNYLQQKKPVEKLVTLMQNKINQNLINKKIAVLGLSFKANTDDIRYSPSIATIQYLQQLGAHVVAYDPVANNNMKTLFSDIQYCQTPYEAVTDADGIIIMTDWDHIKQIDFVRVKELVKQPFIIDARNCINPNILKRLGFICDSIGQSHLYRQKNECTYKVFSYTRN